MVEAVAGPSRDLDLSPPPGYYTTYISWANNVRIVPSDALTYPPTCPTHSRKYMPRKEPIHEADLARYIYIYIYITYAIRSQLKIYIYT